MKRPFFALAGVAATAAFLACGGFGSDDPAVDADAATDGPLAEAARPDAPSIVDAGEGGPSAGPCTSDMPFIKLSLIEGVDTTAGNEFGPRLTPDELQMVMGRVAVATNVIQRFDRASANDPWTPGPVVISDPGYEFTMPWLSPDGQRLFYARIGHGEAYTHIARVTVIDAGVTDPAVVEVLDDGVYPNHDPFLSPDESDIWFASAGRTDESFDIIRAVKNGSGGFKEPTRVNVVNTVENERAPVISTDGLTLYFASDLDRANEVYGIRMATRASLVADFNLPVVPAGLESLDAFSSLPSWISPDNCRLYFTTTLNGPNDAYVASRR